MRSDAELPASRPTSQAFEYWFKTEGLKKGKNTILFENTGAQPHHLIFAPINTAATIADVEKLLHQTQSASRRSASGSIDRGPRGRHQPGDRPEPAEGGNYALLCFITDRQGGPAHVAKGMVAEVDVK